MRINKSRNIKSNIMPIQSIQKYIAPVVAGVTGTALTAGGLVMSAKGHTELAHQTCSAITGKLLDQAAGSLANQLASQKEVVSQAMAATIQGVTEQAIKLPWNYPILQLDTLNAHNALYALSGLEILNPILDLDIDIQSTLKKCLTDRLTCEIIGSSCLAGVGILLAGYGIVTGGKLLVNDAVSLGQRVVKYLRPTKVEEVA